jgi:hypothetical protein
MVAGGGRWDALLTRYLVELAPTADARSSALLLRKTFGGHPNALLGYPVSRKLKSRGRGFQLRSKVKKMETDDCGTASRL